MSINATKGLGKFYGFIDDNTVRDFKAVDQLESSQQQDRIFNRRQFIWIPVDMRDDFRTQVLVLGNGPGKQVDEMSGICLVETMRLPDVCDDGGRIIFVQQPFIQSLKSEFTGAPPWGTVFGWVGVDGLGLQYSFLMMLSSSSCSLSSVSRTSSML